MRGAPRGASAHSASRGGWPAGRRCATCAAAAAAAGWWDSAAESQAGWGEERRSPLHDGHAVRISSKPAQAPRSQCVGNAHTQTTGEGGKGGAMAARAAVLNRVMALPRHSRPPHLRRCLLATAAASSRHGGRECRHACPPAAAHPPRPPLPQQLAAPAADDAGRGGALGDARGQALQVPRLRLGGGKPRGGGTAVCGAARPLCVPQLLGAAAGAARGAVQGSARVRGGGTQWVQHRAAMPDNGTGRSTRSRPDGDSHVRRPRRAQAVLETKWAEPRRERA